MKVAHANSYHQLIIDGEGDRAVFVFLDIGIRPMQLPANGPGDNFVCVEMLAQLQDVGRIGSIPVSRPVLGRWPHAMNRYRQFATAWELEEAGWEPVPQYRFVDSLEDYFSPWSCPAPDWCAMENSTGHLGEMTVS